jgi:hypothetical protein
MTIPPEERDIRELRASDHDRDRIAEVLRQAAGEGRLTLDELDERLEALYAAKTYGELEPITRDLPVGSPPAVPVAADRPAAERIGGEPTSSFAVAIMGGFSRKGSWVAPRDFTAAAFWGGGEIDLREARFAERVVTIRAFAVMGGIDVIVPEDAEVDVQGIGILGGFDDRASGPGAAGAPRIVVKGCAFWGSASVKRKPKDSELKRRKQEHKQRKRELKRQHREERKRLEGGGGASD